MMFIKEMLTLRGVSQNELANRMGVSLSAVKQMVSAESITTNTLNKIANAIGCEICEFFIDPYKKPQQPTSAQVTTCPHCGKPITVVVMTPTDE